MSHYKPYPAYRDSEVEWIGEVPEHWGKNRLKYLISITMGQSPSSDDCHPEPIGEPFLQGCAEFGKFHPIPNRYCSTHSKTARKGEILFSVRAPVGRLNVADQDYGIGRGLCSMRGVNINQEFLTWALAHYKAELDIESNGTTYDGVSCEQIGAIVLYIPGVAEQCAIAQSLNHEAARIDALIAKKIRFIELLKEKRQALITHAVTKGLDPKVKMKDSGVEWIGEVPEHWNIYRMATLFKEAVRVGRQELPVLSISIHDGITDEEIDPEERYRQVYQIEDRTKYKRVAPDDLAYNMMRAWQGAFGAVKVEGLVSPAYVVAEPIRDFRTSYIELLLRTPMAVEEMRRFSRGIADFRMRLYWEYFRDLVVCLPPLFEQDSILEHISTESTRIDLLSQKTQHSIDLLKERRSAFITAAVTGKIDLRNKNVTKEQS